eukprot:1196237-Prorocentrum_minimum.AAC.1
MYVRPGGAWRGKTGDGWLLDEPAAMWPGCPSQARSSGDVGEEPRHVAGCPSQARRRAAAASGASALAEQTREDFREAKVPRGGTKMLRKAVSSDCHSDGGRTEGPCVGPVTGGALFEQLQQHSKAVEQQKD